MGSFISKQPNGLYCRFSTVVDCPTNWNMTKEAYIVLCMEEAYKEAIDDLENYLKPFSEVMGRYISNNMSQNQFDKFLEEVKYV